MVARGSGTRVQSQESATATPFHAASNPLRVP